MDADIVIQASRRFGALSPLRYPGGKASLAGFFGDLLQTMGLDEIKYVEPYAGGAGAGVALLSEGIIDSLVINDFDPAVHAFWLTITRENERLVDAIRNAELSVDEWQRQRSIYRAGDESDSFSLGFAFYYLNRTNRSGILNAGVIGGLNQTGNYKIDARFNKERLVERVTRVGELAPSITVLNLDGRTVIGEYANDSNVFMYIDPPYVQAGGRLYLNAFDDWDHSALARSVHAVPKAHWLMTYDVAPLIQHLYRDYFQCRLGISYSAKHYIKAQELLIASASVASAIVESERQTA